MSKHSFELNTQCAANISCSYSSLLAPHIRLRAVPHLPFWQFSTLLSTLQVTLNDHQLTSHLQGQARDNQGCYIAATHVTCFQNLQSWGLGLIIFWSIHEFWLCDIYIIHLRLSYLTFFKTSLPFTKRQLKNIFLPKSLRNTLKHFSAKI